ncbi:MAG: glmS [Chlamydiales bacterium]|nr:glmS [Chlamydiales bacterium]
MCGIFGYLGKSNAFKICLDSLKQLEYRGYDSAGIAGIDNGQLVVCKEVGKVDGLKKAVEGIDLSLAISHTRWATHGKPTLLNTHPHLDESKTVAVVHNGIIENYTTLKKTLQGTSFYSDTDTEVVAKMIGSRYRGNLIQAVVETTKLLEGAFALAIIHASHPEEMVVVAKDCPLAIGIGEGETFVCSDPNVFAKFTKQVIFLAHGEIALIQKNGVEIFNSALVPVSREVQVLEYASHESSKGNFEHYTLKEIFEQPQTLLNTMYARYLEEYGTALLEGISENVNDLLGIERVLILACGTSLHAGYIGGYMLEDLARLPVQVEISSEFRYKNPIVPPGTFVIAISQSGETADTMAAVRELKAKGAKIFGICNVQGSSLSREADACVFLRAGAEIGVCSTKAFTSQLIILALFTLQMARVRNLSRLDGQDFLKALKEIPYKVEQVLAQSDKILEIAKKYAHFDNFFFVGRRYMYPASLEGALKLKEISYINANGYPAGELKHGPIALISESCPTIALAANKQTLDKLISNLMEIKARGGPIIAIAEEGMDAISQVADDVIFVPQTIDPLSAIVSIVATQLFAYYVAKERGAEIDQPRNLAKSVTVE